MGRDDTVVVVGSGDKGGGVWGAGTEVVEGGIGTEVAEHLRGVVAGAVVGGPVPADGELMVAQHVHDTDLGDGDTEEVGTLRHAGSDKQASIGAADDGEKVAGGIALADEVLGSGDEVVEDVLLLHLGTGEMPLLAILAAAAQVNLGIDAALLEEGNTGG